MAGLKCESGHLGLEGLQCQLAHCCLWESNPQQDSSGDEIHHEATTCILITGEGCWHLPETCIMASGSSVKR